MHYHCRGRMSNHEQRADFVGLHHTFSTVCIVGIPAAYVYSLPSSISGTSAADVASTVWWTFLRLLGGCAGVLVALRPLATLGPGGAVATWLAAKAELAVGALLASRVCNSSWPDMSDGAASVASVTAIAACCTGGFAGRQSGTHCCDLTHRLMRFLVVCLRPGRSGFWLAVAATALEADAAAGLRAILLEDLVLLRGRALFWLPLCCLTHLCCDVVVLSSPSWLQEGHVNGLTGPKLQPTACEHSGGLSAVTASSAAAAPAAAEMDLGSTVAIVYVSCVLFGEAGT